MNAYMGGMVMGFVIHTGMIAVSLFAPRRVAMIAARIIWRPTVGLKPTIMPMTMPSAMACGESWIMIIDRRSSLRRMMVLDKQLSLPLCFAMNSRRCMRLGCRVLRFAWRGCMCLLITCCYYRVYETNCCGDYAIICIVI